MSIARPSEVEEPGADGHARPDGAPGRGPTPPAASLWPLLAVLAVALIPVAVLAITRAGRPYLPVQDFAVNDLRVRDVFSGDTPLVGPYSRYGWSHPGPLLFWLAAPFSRLFGSPPWATQLGFALLQAAAIAWIGILSRRRRGLWAAAVWLGVVMLSYLPAGPFAWLEAWGPNVALPFFVLFCCQLWLLRADSLELLAQIALVGSFLVQTHVGYGPLVACGALLCIPSIWRAGQGSWSGVVRLRALRWAAVALVVVWLPALVETLLHWPGNVARLVQHTVIDPTDARAGLGTGAGLVAAAFRPLPEWLGGTGRVEPLNGNAVPASPAWLLVPLVLLAGAWWLARRHDDRDGARMATVCGAMLVAGVVALTNLEGPALPYLFGVARNALGALTLVTVVVVGFRWFARACPRVSVVLAVVGTVVVIAAVVPTAAHLAASPTEYDRLGPATADLLAQLDAGGAPDGPVLIRHVGTSLGGVEGGIFDELARRGAPVRVDPDRTYQFGDDRGATPDQVSEIWYVVEASEQASLVSALPGARVLARHSPLSPDDLDRLTELQREVAAQVGASGAGQISDVGSSLVGFALDGHDGFDRADVDQLAMLNQRVADAGSCVCAVIAVPPSYDGPVP